MVGQNQIRKSSHWFYDKYLDVLLNSYALNLQIVDRIIIKDPKDIKIIEMEFAKKEFDDKKKMNISKLLRKRKVPYFCLVEWKYFPPVNAPPLMSTIFDNMKLVLLFFSSSHFILRIILIFSRMFESIDFDIPDKRNNCLDFEDLNITFDKDLSDIVFSDELQCVTMNRPLQKSPILFFPYIVLFSAMLFFE